jgi:hypothetical protein
MKKEHGRKTNGINPRTELAGDYARIFGHCQVCGGPVWFNRLIDSLGTPLLTYHCWNGHYQTLDEQMLGLYNRGAELSPEDIKRILPFIKLIRIEK